MKETSDKVLTRYRLLFPDIAENNEKKMPSSQPQEFNTALNQNKAIINQLSEMT